METKQPEQPNQNGGSRSDAVSGYLKEAHQGNYSERERGKLVTDPLGCNHDEFLDFDCGDYKCSACEQDFEVRCDGDEGRCPICGPKCNMEIYSPKPRRYCGEPGKWKHPRYQHGVFCEGHYKTLLNFLPDGWQPHGAVAPAPLSDN